MSVVTQHGYLLLADISGYTSFVAGTELEHSQEILSDLLTVICERIESVMLIHKLEGDAVFAYLNEEHLPHGERLLDLIDSTYTAFRDKRDAIRRGTTCTCNACLNIPSLDLKFIAHHGDYIIQQVRDIKEMVGSDVNLAHRLMKNHVAEKTGWHAYMLLTERCLEHMQVNLEDAHVSIESYEHLEETKTYSLDLPSRYQQIVEARRVQLTPEDATIVMTADLKIPPIRAWDWYYNPEKKNLWMTAVKWYSGNRPNGRMGVGASNHCAHGKGVSTEVVLNWHPFDYATTESYENSKRTGMDTIYFTPLPDGGTHVVHCMFAELPIPKSMRKFVGWVARKALGMDKMEELLVKLTNEEYEKMKAEV